VIADGNDHAQWCGRCRSCSCHHGQLGAGSAGEVVQVQRGVDEPVGVAGRSSDGVVLIALTGGDEFAGRLNELVVDALLTRAGCEVLYRCSHRPSLPAAHLVSVKPIWLGDVQRDSVPLMIGQRGFGAVRRGAA
jgi:hypothetical protein